MEEIKQFKKDCTTCADNCEFYKKKGFCGGCVKDIKHINKKNQEYIAEGNRMTAKINPQTNYTTKAFYPAEEYKRLEQENAELKETIQELNKAIQDCNIQRTRLYKALEEIRGICKSSKVLSCSKCPIRDDCEELCTNDDNLQNIILDKINGVLGNEDNSK